MEVQIHGDHEGDPRITVFHYRYPIGFIPDAAVLAGLAFDVATRILPRMAAMVSDHTRWNSIIVKDIGAAGRLQTVYPLSPVVPGTRNSEPLPGVVNFNMKKGVNVSGKHTFGELLVPDLTEDIEDDSQVSGAYLTLAGNLAVQLLQRAVAGAYPPVVASKTHTIFYLITAFVFDAFVSTLVTRQLGHRRHRRRRTTT
jgi:hypothetical protein